MAQTDEQKARESRKRLTLSTLEKKLNQNILGANVLSDFAKYGEMGKNAAQGAFDNDDVRKEREYYYKQLVQEYESLGIAGKPGYPSDPDFSYHVIQGLEQVMSNSYIEDLAKGINKFVPELKFKLPDELKNYIPYELNKKAANNEGKLDLSKLNQDEQAALSVYQNLREAYRLGAGHKMIVNGDYLRDVKGKLDFISEEYNPTPKEDGK